LEGPCDKDLVVAARQGDRAAYANLVRRHYKAVFLVCVGVLGNVHDSEDAAQDAMFKGFEKIRQLRQADQFGHWIITIARNVSINLLRKRSTAGRVLEQTAPSQGWREGTTEDVREAVAKLPCELRLPLVMYYFDGRSVKTVAEKLNVSTSGVYAKLRMAIRELHEILTVPGETS
jgi:RNA polymerase sigma factor (sigma-70 family)